jgi:hypothetical protein
VEGPACKSVKTQELLKVIGSAELWISDPTAEGAVDRAMVAVHEFMVDRPLKRERVRDLVHPSQISRPRTRTSEGRRGDASSEVRRRTPSHYTGHHFARAWALHVAGEHASKPRGSGERRGHPRRPAPEGGRSASPASPWSGHSAQGSEKRAGRLCSPREEASGEVTGEGKAAVMEFDDGGGSGGAPADGNQSSRRCTIRWRLPLNNQRHVRDTIASGKEKIGQRSTSPTASDGSERQRRRCRWNWCSSACTGVLRVQRGVREPELELK